MVVRLKASNIPFVEHSVMYSCLRSAFMVVVRVTKLFLDVCFLGGHCYGAAMKVLYGT